MEDSGYMLSLKHSLWHIFAGTKGGVTRIRIVELLRERPYNVNQLHDKLGLDYKTVQHHVKVLARGNVITTEEGKKYGSMCFLSPAFEKNVHFFDEILEKTGERQINKGGKNKGD